MIYDVTFTDDNGIKTSLAHALALVVERKGSYAYVRVDEYPELIKVIGEYKTPDDSEDPFEFNLEINQMLFVAMIYVGGDIFQHSCYIQRENDWIYTLLQEGNKTKDIEVTILNSSDVDAKVAIREGKAPSFISAMGNAAQEFVNKIAVTPTTKKLIKPGLILPENFSPDQPKIIK